MTSNLKIQEIIDRSIDEGGRAAVEEVVVGILTGRYPVGDQWSDIGASDVTDYENLLTVSGRSIINHAYNNINEFIEDRDSFLIDIMQELSFEMKVVSTMSSVTSRQVAENISAMLKMDEIATLVEEDALTD